MSASSDARHYIAAVERAEADLVRLRALRDCACARFSDERGYRLRLRPDQVKRELAMLSVAGGARAAAAAIARYDITRRPRYAR